MIGEKFYVSICSLDKKELNNFIRYTKNEFFNKRLEIVTTLELFKRNKKNFKQVLENETLIFKNVFSKIKKFDKKLLTDHFHYCHKILEEFIVYFSIQNDDEKKLNILSDFYKNKNLSKEALNINAKLIKRIEKDKLNQKKYYKLYDLYLKKFLIEIDGFDNETFGYLEKSLHYLDDFYFLTKLNLDQELQSNAIMNNVKYHSVLKDEIKTLIKDDSKFFDNILFKIFDISSDLYSRKFDKETFFKFRDLILKNIELFDFNTKKNFLTDINNYLSLLYSKSPEKEFLNEFFNIYKIQIEHKTILKNGYYDDANISQVLRIASALNEHEWIMSFFEKNDNLILNKSILNIGKANVFFNLKEYDKVLTILNNVELQNVKQSFELKTIYAKTLFETKEYVLLESHLNSFELYLRRHDELSDQIKSFNLKFILFLKRFLKYQFDKSKVLKLKEELTEEKKIFNRLWLMNKLDEALT